MKKTLLAAIGLAVLFAFGCGNSNEKTKEELKAELKKELREEMNAKKENTANNESETTDSRASENADYSVVKAQFEMMFANTAGTFYVFKDENGQSMDMMAEPGAPGLEFTRSLRPGDTSHQYYHKWYTVTYEERTIDYKGEPAKRLFIISVEPTTSAGGKSNDTGSLSGADLKNAVFFGVEPNWTVWFYEDYAEYEPMGQSKMKVYYKKSYADNSRPKLSQAIKQFSKGEIQVQGDADGWGTLFTIKKEKCSDGMSDNTYPYSIKLLFDESEELSGCGRIK